MGMVADAAETPRGHAWLVTDHRLRRQKMSARTIARCAVALASLAGPTATAVAMPADPVDTGAYVTAETPEAGPVGGGGGETDSTLVWVLAGSTLLAGAMGFEGGRVLARRGAPSH
jgi:hypothetical protein